jgi:predicted AAA+ superfamily ATPase
LFLIVKNFSNKVNRKSEISYEIYSKLYDEYLMYGGFPGVVIEEDINRKKIILSDIFKSYFEKDVKGLSDFREINKLRDTLLLISGRTGSKFEVSKIASEIGISRETVYSYLDFLEKTYFISIVKPFSKGINGEVKGAKKIYLCDVGIANYLGKISEEAIFENAIFNILKTKGKVSYYQKYKGPEIDFIFDKKTGLEVKIKADQSDIKKLENVSTQIKLNEFYVISKQFHSNEKVILAQDL